MLPQGSAKKLFATLRGAARSQYAEVSLAELYAVMQHSRPWHFLDHASKRQWLPTSVSDLMDVAPPSCALQCCGLDGTTIEEELPCASLRRPTSCTRRAAVKHAGEGEELRGHLVQLGQESCPRHRVVGAAAVQRDQDRITALGIKCDSHVSCECIRARSRLQCRKKLKVDRLS